MYQYDQIDQKIVDERVAQYGDQVRRRLSGELSEEEFFAPLIANARSNENDEWKDLGESERMEAERGLDGMPPFWREQLLAYRQNKRA